MLVTVALFVLGLILICLGGDRLVDAAVAIARKIGIPQIVVGATIVSLGTTLPEILVSTTAAFDGSAAIAAGNAFGSIICNTALIAGLTQTLRPTKKVETKPLLWRAAIFFGVIIVLEIVGFLRGEFGRLVGFLLLAMFVVYAVLNIVRAGSEGGDEEENLLVDNGILIAEAIGVPQRVIAVTFIALGTSLPELVTSIVSMIKGFSNVGFGNILGANILNILAVIGIPAAVVGIPLEASTYQMDIPLAALVMAILIVPILIRKKASRLQGIVLLAIYAAYCVVSFI